MKIMTHDRVAALADIQTMLGLENTRLTKKAQWKLLDLFHSVPREHQEDDWELLCHLQPAILSLKAFSTARTHTTARNSAQLMEALNGIQGKVRQIMA
jgi:hypothetical protein